MQSGLSVHSILPPYHPLSFAHPNVELTWSTLRPLRKCKMVSVSMAFKILPGQSSAVSVRGFLDPQNQSGSSVWFVTANQRSGQGNVFSCVILFTGGSLYRAPVPAPWLIYKCKILEGNKKTENRLIPCILRPKNVIFSCFLNFNAIKAIY